MNGGTFVNGGAAFEYAVLRVVPRPERGEFVNAGVVLYCPARRYLDAVIRFDPLRARALHAGADVDGIAAALAAWPRVCAGEGLAGHESLGARFRWLTAPRSTVVQPGPVHTGLTADPEVEAVRLLDLLVEPPS